MDKSLAHLFFLYDEKNEHNFGVRRVLKGVKGHMFIILCSFLILFSNSVSLLHIGSSLTL